MKTLEDYIAVAEADTGRGDPTFRFRGNSNAAWLPDVGELTWTREDRHGEIHLAFLPRGLYTQARLQTIADRALEFYKYETGENWGYGTC